MSLTARVTVLACIALALGACASQKKVAVKTGPSRADALGPDSKGTGGARCDASAAGREASEYDTSGDGKPDVRKVFLMVGAKAEMRLVMICRESDVNRDGKKDVIRYYDDEGRSLREESDRDFDGKMDAALIFQDGRVVQQEFDQNRDGKIDTKIFLDKDKPVRAERDLAGRSTTAQWRPDRWEYYEEGRMVRMGTDLDGDTRVDRWDRDLQWKAAMDAKEQALDGPAPNEGEAAKADGEAAPPAPAAPAAPAPAPEKKK